MTTPATAKPTAAGRMRLRGVTLTLIEVYICGQPGRKSRFGAHTEPWLCD
jgi:hypothetical protein